MKQPRIVRGGRRRWRALPEDPSVPFNALGPALAASTSPLLGVFWAHPHSELRSLASIPVFAGLIPEYPRDLLSGSADERIKIQQILDRQRSLVYGEVHGGHDAGVVAHRHGERPDSRIELLIADRITQDGDFRQLLPQPLLRDDVLSPPRVIVLGEDALPLILGKERKQELTYTGAARGYSHPCANFRAVGFLTVTLAA